MNIAWGTREQRLGIERTYIRNHPEKTQAKNARRRALKLGAEGSYTDEDVKRIFKQQRGRCAYCRVKLLRFHVDHIKALASGGSNKPSNIQLTCSPCNSRKSNKDPINYARSIGLLL